MKFCKHIKDSNNYMCIFFDIRFLFSVHLGAPVSFRWGYLVNQRFNRKYHMSLCLPCCSPQPLPPSLLFFFYILFFSSPTILLPKHHVHLFCPLVIKVNCQALKFLIGLKSVISSFLLCFNIF